MRKSGGERQPERMMMTVNQQKPISAMSHFNFVQGDFEVTVVSDGFITVPIDIVAPERSPDERAEILRRTGDQKTGLVESKTNIPIIKKGDDLMIVDIGSGDKYQTSDGRLAERLVAAGIDASATSIIHACKLLLVALIIKPVSL